MAISYFQRGNCYFMLGQYDMAIQSYNDAKENIRHGEVVDYDSLHLAYMLCKSEISLNIAISFYYCDMTDECNAMLDEAKRYTIVKDDIHAVTQQMIGGEEVYPCTVDDTTLFNPPKLPQSVIDAMRKAGGGGGWSGGASSPVPTPAASTPSYAAASSPPTPSYAKSSYHSASPPSQPKLAPPARAAPKKGFGAPATSPSMGSPPSAGAGGPPPPPPPQKPKVGPKPKLPAPAKKAPLKMPATTPSYNSAPAYNAAPSYGASAPSYGASSHSAAPPLPPPNNPASPRGGGPLSPRNAPSSFSAPAPASDPNPGPAPPLPAGGGGPPGPPPPIPKGGIPQRKIESASLSSSGGSSGSGAPRPNPSGPSTGSAVSSDALQAALARRMGGGSSVNGTSSAPSSAGSTPRPLGSSAPSSSPGSARFGPTVHTAPLSNSTGSQKVPFGANRASPPASSPAPPKGPAPVKAPAKVGGSFKFQTTNAASIASPPQPNAAPPPTSPRGGSGEGIAFKVLAEQGARKKKVEATVTTPAELRLQITQAFEVSADTLVEHYDPDFGEFVELDNGVNLSSLPTMLKVRVQGP